MKKSDLKTGMRVELRDGEMMLVLKDIGTKFHGHQELGFVSESDFMIGTSYDEDLNCVEVNSDYCDIVKVYTTEGDDETCLLNKKTLDLTDLELIWERKE